MKVKLQDVLTNDTPRLVIMYKKDENGNDNYQWGVVNSIPVLSLIGLITRVQSELVETDNFCDELALVIVWDPVNNFGSYYIHPNIPVDSMLGMLETIKAMLVNSRLAQHAAAQQMVGSRKLFGPDGSILRN